eukprot:scaffold3248_cov112-Cylindrotheca_fusiformis.AAC.9
MSMIGFWIVTTIYFISSFRESPPSSMNTSTIKEDDESFAIALDFYAPTLETNTTIRISVFHDQCPDTWKFLRWLIVNQKTDCSTCTIYRGEPVPSYWGSANYPDRYYDGGRWGPPYALVQGGFVNSKISDMVREDHRPAVVKRGDVAWAGDQGLHFFMALADHPEWGTTHTVWGHVFSEDQALLDQLVEREPRKVHRHCAADYHGYREHNIPLQDQQLCRFLLLYVDKETAE